MAKKKKEPEQVSFTLYSIQKDTGQIQTVIQECFKPVTKNVQINDNSVILTLQDGSPMLFSINLRDKMGHHFGQMMNFFGQVPVTENLNELRQSVVEQISLSQSLIGCVFVLDDEEEERTNFLIGAIHTVAERLGGLVLYPDMSLHTPSHKLLLSTQGESELTEYLPIANSDRLEAERGEAGEADEARKARSIAQLKKKGIPFIEHLPCEVYESEAQIRTPEETLHRAVTLFSLASYSQKMLAKNADISQARKTFEGWDEQFGIRAYLTPKELDSINTPEPDENTCWQFIWRFEAANPLFWALGLVDELVYPSKFADTAALYALLDHPADMKSVLAKAQMRSEAEIMDAADLNLRYDWACVDARIKNQKAPAELNSEIVMERHLALDWLIGSNNGADWDDVHPHT